MLALAIVWVLFVPLADWLARHDVGSVGGPLHETAVDNARGRLLTLGAGLFVAGALVFTARNFTLSREGQVTDRYTKAIEQLGSDKLDVRVGGIYALERIARDSARDRPVVMEVLTGDPQDGRALHLSSDAPRAGDRWLLTSDGLTDYVPLPLVLQCLGSAASPQEAADLLVDTAVAHHAHDNVSVIVADVVAIDDEPVYAPAFGGSAALAENVRPSAEAPARPAAERAKNSRRFVNTIISIYI